MRGRLTRIGKDIAILEGQEEFTPDDRRMVEHLLLLLLLVTDETS